MKMNTSICQQLLLYLLICFTIKSIKSKKSNAASYNIGELRNVQDNNDNIRKSLVFVFDNTNSMRPELNKVIEGATLIFDTIRYKDYNMIENYIFVPFNDPTIGPILKTTDEALFKKTLKELNVGGGGDCPEFALTGIKAALEICLPYSYIYVFSDASAKDVSLIETVLELVQRKKSQVVFILTGNCGDRPRKRINYEVYEQIKAVSSGQIFHLKKNEVSEVLKYINDNIGENVVDLHTNQYPKSEHNDTVAVDNTLDKVTVSVAGGNSNVTVVNPSGEEVSDPDKFEKIIDLTEIKVFNIIDPEPGNWTVIISSDNDHSVKITGVSEIQFDLGYFINDTSSFTETCQRPLKGVANRLLVRIRNDAGLVSQLDNVELANGEGKVLIELTLTKDKNVVHIYKSQPFLPPDGYFYTTVSGVDKDGNRIKRSGSTALTAQNPEKPYITVKPQVLVYPHESLTLSCLFESLIPVSASWFRDDKPLQTKQDFVFSNKIEYVVKNVIDSATYTCKAENSVGASTGETKVKITDATSKIKESNLPIKKVHFYLDDLGNGMFTFNMGTKQFTALMNSK